MNKDIYVNVESTEDSVRGFIYRKNYGPHYARNEIEQEIDYIASRYDGRRDCENNITEVEYLREYLRFIALQLDMYGYDCFINKYRLKEDDEEFQKLLNIYNPKRNLKKESYND